MLILFICLCHSKNKPPALRGEEISLDERISRVSINVGLQTTNKNTGGVQ